jgi:hypothetical protein
MVKVGLMVKVRVMVGVMVWLKFGELDQVGEIVGLQVRVGELVKVKATGVGVADKT